VTGLVFGAAAGRRQAERQSTTSSPAAKAGRRLLADQRRGGVGVRVGVVIRASSPQSPLHTIHRYNFATMAIDVYWSRGSPFCWRVLLALEVKGLDYRSHQLNTDLQAHKAPQMLAMNPRGRLPVLRDGDYVVFESLAVLYYLDLVSEPPISAARQRGWSNPAVIDEFRRHRVRRCASSPLRGGTGAVLGERITQAMHVVAGEARTIEGRLSKGDWIVGDAVSAADLAIYPCIRFLLQALLRPEAQELSARFLPAEIQYPALARWMRRMEALPGFRRTWPPDWPQP
jgi:glutathione S-transferase